MLAVSMTTAGAARATPPSGPPSPEKGRPEAVPCSAGLANLLYEEAAALRDRGNAVIKEGRVHEALRLWLSAWEKHPGDGALACDIGRAAFMTGDPVAAARWLTRCANLLPNAETPDEMLSRRAEAMDLAVARARIAELQIETEPGTSLSVDGIKVGESPFSEPIFVKPGEHRIEAQKGALRAIAFTSSKAGETRRIDLPLEPQEPRRIERPTLAPMPMKPSADLGASQAVSQAAPPPPQREFVWWPIAAGAALASMAFTTGAVLRVWADQADSGAQAVQEKLHNQTPTKSCGEELWWHAMCDVQIELVGKRDAYSTVSTTLFIVGGMATAGALSFATFEMGRVRVAPTFAGITGSYQW